MATYYEKNRDVLLQKMKERYDPDKKRAYYEENKEVLAKKMAERYQNKKEKFFREEIEKLLLDDPSPHFTEMLHHLLASGDYKNLTKPALAVLRSRVKSAD